MTSAASKRMICSGVAPVTRSAHASHTLNECIESCLALSGEATCLTSSLKKESSPALVQLLSPFRSTWGSCLHFAAGTRRMISERATSGAGLIGRVGWYADTSMLPYVLRACGIYLRNAIIITIITLIEGVQVFRHKCRWLYLRETTIDTLNLYERNIEIMSY